MKILVVCANALDSTSWWRAWGIFPDIQRRSDIEFTSFNHYRGFSWMEAGMFDAAFFQRGFGEQLTFAKILKGWGLKIIYELDDCFWEIPRTNPHKQFFTKEVLGEIEEFIKLADLVTVTTKALAEYVYTKTGVMPEVLPNALDLKKFPISPFNQDGGYVWRGGASHSADLETYRNEIQHICKGKRIDFWGHNPVDGSPFLHIEDYTYIQHVHPLTKVADVQDPKTYMHTISKSGAKIFLCPLEENVFNSCKSNIAWIEATMSGAVLVGNQWGEFSGRGINFKDFDMANTEQQAIEHKHSVIDINANYNLEKVNNKRIELFKSLISVTQNLTTA